MATISQLIRQHTAIDFTTIVKDALYSNREELVKQQQQQMLEGKTSTGGKIGKYRGSLRYKRMKFDLNPLAGYGNIDLRLTGAFYRGIKVYFFSTAFFFKSTDYKNDILTSEYGEDIWGLAPIKQRKVSREMIKPIAIRAILEKTFAA